MLIDITLKTTPKMVKDAQINDSIALSGHVGTHFDVMNKEFPLEYTRRAGIMFDVSRAEGRDIDVGDIDLTLVEKDMFVGLSCGYLEKVGYATQPYFKEHPQLSDALIDALIDKGVSIIGVDFAGIRRGKEHVPADQRCADKGLFVIENLCNLRAVLDAGPRFTAHTYPMNYAGMSGLPCRVIAEI